MGTIARAAAIGAAAIVGVKYLDAKLDLHHDLNLITAGILSRIQFK
jgi:hypothetical protein